MRRIGSGFKYLFTSVLIVGWVGAYIALPLLSRYDGPFDAQPFGFAVSGLPFISRTDLKVLGITVFVLESRENLAGPGHGFCAQEYLWQDSLDQAGRP